MDTKQNHLVTPFALPARALGGRPSSCMDLTGMTVVVTGASSGIGRASAIALAACGADVILLSRSESGLAGLGADIERQYAVQVRTIALDLLDTRAMRDRLAAIPRLDALVNNAGHNIPRWFGDVDEASFDAVFALNVKAGFFVAQACVARFRARGGGGALVNVSSQMGHDGAPRRTVYCGSKYALEGFTKAMAVELAPEAIRVNAVCPTFVVTPMTAPMFENDEFRTEVTSKIPMGRVGTVEEVTGAIAFLFSPAGSLITGASLLVDGGWTAQ
jgi:NAD(P)-dependent dehydrogenase (short-subunit alcohol dehydrogenase family)